MEAWQRVLWAEVCGADEICTLRCVCKFLAASVDALSRSAFGASLQQLGRCRDKRLLRALLPHAAALCAHASALQSGIGPLIRLLQDGADVEQAYSEAWRLALDAADGSAFVVNDAARENGKCLVSALLLRPRTAGGCAVVVRSAREPTWEQIFGGEPAFEILDVPYLFGIKTLPARTNDPTYVLWREWLERAMHLRDFLHDPASKEVLESSVHLRAAAHNHDGGDDGDGPLISYKPGMSQLWWAIAATSHLGWVLAKDKLWRCVLRPPANLWVEWVWQWTAEEAACVASSKQQREKIENLLANWHAVKIRIHGLPRRLILALQPDELLQTPDTVLSAAAALLQDGLVPFEGVRSLVHKCVQLQSLLRPLRCSLGSKVVAHAFARNPALSVDRLEQFVSSCFLSGQPFVSLRVWLRFVHPMAWPAGAHEALLDEVFASTMVTTLLAFSPPSVMRLFQDAAQWCEQVRAATGESDVVSIVAQLLLDARGADARTRGGMPVVEECVEMRLAFVEFVARDECRVASNTLHMLVSATLTHHDDAAQKDNVGGDDCYWYA